MTEQPHAVPETGGWLRTATDPPRLVTLSEAAATLGITERTLRKLRHGNHYEFCGQRIARVAFSPRHVRVPTTDLEQAIRNLSAGETAAS